MKYELITVESFGISTKHVIIDNEDGSFVSFPADENNPNYTAFLKEQNKTIE